MTFTYIQLNVLVNHRTLTSIVCGIGGEGVGLLCWQPLCHHHIVGVGVVELKA